MRIVILAVIMLLALAVPAQAQTNYNVIINTPTEFYAVSDSGSTVHITIEDGIYTQVGTWTTSDGQYCTSTVVHNGQEMLEQHKTCVAEKPQRGRQPIVWRDRLTRTR